MIAWAFVIIMLLLACLNTLLSLIDGNISDAKISPKTLPAPMLGSWSESPTKIMRQESLNAFKRLSKSSASIIEASSIIMTSQESGFFSLREN